MNISDLYPSRYLSAADLQGQPARCIIRELTQELVGAGADAKVKPVLAFVGKAKLLVVNKTNAQSIAAQHGNDTAGWAGKEIVLRPEVVSFQGRPVAAVRVDTPTPSRPAEPTRAASLPPAAGLPEDEIPF